MDAKLFRTRLGWAAAAAEKGCVRYVHLPTDAAETKSALRSVAGVGYSSSPLLDSLASDITGYFEGKKAGFRRYHVRLAAGTAFQRKVWSQTAKIPYGCTMTYGELAERIGAPDAARAVGGALNSNPTPLLVPCHRVVSSTGVGGFSAGADLKKEMLELEGIL